MVFTSAIDEETHWTQRSLGEIFANVESIRNYNNLCLRIKETLSGHSFFSKVDQIITLKSFENSTEVYVSGYWNSHKLMNRGAISDGARFFLPSFSKALLS